VLSEQDHTAGTHPNSQDEGHPDDMNATGVFLRAARARSAELPVGLQVPET
jgi:hypothetical protein